MERKVPDVFDVFGIGKYFYSLYRTVHYYVTSQHR